MTRARVGDIRYATIKCNNDGHAAHGGQVEWRGSEGVGDIIKSPYGDLKILKVVGFTVECEQVNTIAGTTQRVEFEDKE